MPEIRMIIGSPASGKTTVAQEWIDKGYIHLNRDRASILSLGQKVGDLLPRMVAELKIGHNVVLDNTYPTAMSRKPFLEAAQRMGIQVHGHVMLTSLEDAQINALCRMWQRYGRIIWTGKDKEITKDPNIFPPAVLFKYRSEYEPPVMAEGFTSIIKIPFKRVWGPEFKNKAYIFDYDGTLRESKGEYKYPTCPEDVRVDPKRGAKLIDLMHQGYVLLGASNQSGVSRGHLTEEQARLCFDTTNIGLMGMKAIDYEFCPHHVPPISCYCRKPGSAIAVHFIHKYKLDPSQCVMCGDSTTDKTFAKRVGFQFITPKEIFG